MLPEEGLREDMLHCLRQRKKQKLQKVRRETKGQTFVEACQLYVVKSASYEIMLCTARRRTRPAFGPRLECFSGLAQKPKGRR